MTTTTTHRNKFCPEKTTRHLFSSLHSVNVTSLLLSLLSWSISSGTFDLAPRKRVFPSKFRPFFFFFSPLRTTKSVQRVFLSLLVPPSRSRFETSRTIRIFVRIAEIPRSAIPRSVSPFLRLTVASVEHGGGWPERRGGRKRAQRFGNEWIKQRDVTGWII